MKTRTRAPQTQAAAAGAKYCAAYIRVSTQDQGERYSPASQLKALRAKAERDGKQIREDWIFPDYHTGKLEARPGLDRLRALVKTGVVGTVYVFDVSRFARRTYDALKLAAEFKQCGAALDFVETPYADTAAGRLGFTTMAAVSEYLGEKLLLDSKRGSLEKLQQGLLTHGSAPFAYTYVDKRQQGGSKLVINESDSSVPGLSLVEVVRDVYNMRKANTPTYQIVKSLNSRGILSAGHWAKGGVWVPPGLWGRQTVLQMLKNPTYKGQHTRSGIVVPCPAIIDEETWNAVQRVSEQSRLQHTGRPSNKYLLRSFVWCGAKSCARRMITFPNHGHGLYRCGNIERKPFKRRCHAPGVSMAIIESAAWSSIWSLLKDPALLLKLGRAYYDAMGKPEGDSTGTLQRERERLAAKIATTQAMMQDNLIAYAKGKADIRAADERVRQIEQELSATRNIVALPPLRAAEAAVRKITTGPEPKTYEGRRSILEGILDLRMTYYKGNLTIEGKVPVPGAEASAGSKEKKCNRGLGANAQSQHHHGDDREGRILAQTARSVAEILEKVREPVHAAHIPAFFFALRDRAQHSQSGVTRFIGSQAARQTLLHLAFEMVLQFLIEILFHSPTAKQRSNAKPKLCHPARHMDPYFARTISETAADSRSHWTVSLASAFRPARVSE
jgi:site-specific DNA recombinase